jgi:hypothetical protein
VGPAADWYAVGVVLYEALTGQVPLAGPPIEVLMNKQRLDAPSPRAINPAAPEDLSRLAAELMRFNPATRPSGKQVLERLGAQSPSGPSAQSLSSFSTSSSFVGRAAELKVLGEKFDRSRKQAQTVCVHGESGLGKSALVRHFVEQLKQRDPGVVALAGTCYERESVPFKAVDGLIDALSQYMRRLPKAEAAALLPRRASLLAQVFPVLQRVEAVAEAPRSAEEVLDPQELRSRLFAALRELLERLADRHPLVLVIDDLQWADADSLALLGELMRPPEAPALLLIATVRSDEAASSANRRQSLTEQLRGEITHLPLGRMSAEESRELAETLVKRAPGQAGLSAVAIAQEAGGHPLFIDELIRHAVAVGAPTPGALQLEDALWARISQLDPEPRRVLELVALSSGRLLQQTAAQAAAVAFGDFTKHVALLRVAHFLRTTGMRASDSVEPYHDRVRRAVLSHLDLATTKIHHRRIAVALETSGQIDPEALAIHWREAGEASKATVFAQSAADKADKALAFDRAARFYQIALELLGPGGRRDLQIKLGDALANAGRGGEAGHAYLRAAEGAGVAEALDLRRRAAEQLLISGHIDDGLATLRQVLDRVGMKLPRTPTEAVINLLRNRVQVRLRGTSFRERSIDQLSPDALTRIDICWSAGIALGLVDSLGGAGFQARNLLLALRAGEPYRVARALALEVAFSSLDGTKSAKRTAKLLSDAEALATRVGHPHARGLVKMSAAVAAFMQGRFRASRSHAEEAQQILRQQCTGVTWELDNSHLYPLWSRVYLGELAGLDELVSRLLTEAQARGDLHLETNLRTRVLHMCKLADDAPDAAREAVDRGIAMWSQSGFHLQNYFTLLSRTEISLYRGAGPQAYEELERAWPMLSRSMQFHLQFVRVETHDLRARCALAAAQHAPDASTARRLETQALQHAVAISRERTAWGEPLAALIRGTVALRRNDASAAQHRLRSALAGFEAVEMQMHAAAVRWCLGETSVAAAYMQAQLVRNPSRMVDLLVPGHPTPSTIVPTPVDNRL